MYLTALAAVPSESSLVVSHALDSTNSFHCEVYEVCDLAVMYDESGFDR